MKSLANTFFRNTWIDQPLLLSPITARRAGATTAKPVARQVESRLVA
jgi:hypothetical protein